jgi:hypothetical protein
MTSGGSRMGGASSLGVALRNPATRLSSRCACGSKLGGGGRPGAAAGFLAAGSGSGPVGSMGGACGSPDSRGGGSRAGGFSSGALGGANCMGVASGVTARRKRSTRGPPGEAAKVGGGGSSGLAAGALSAGGGVYSMGRAAGRAGVLLETGEGISGSLRGVSCAAIAARWGSTGTNLSETVMPGVATTGRPVGRMNVLSAQPPGALGTQRPSVS